MLRKNGPIWLCNQRRAARLIGDLNCEISSSVVKYLESLLATIKAVAGDKTTVIDLYDSLHSQDLTGHCTAFPRSSPKTDWIEFIGT